MKRIDLDTVESNHGGLKGLFERTMRRFKTGMHIALMLPVYFGACVTLGLSIAPGVALFRSVSRLTAGSSDWVQDIGMGLSLSTGFFLYGFSMLILTPLLNFIFRTKLKAWRGPYYSIESFKWFMHNGLTYLVRFTFLEFVTPSPISLLYYKMMGMKIGRGSVFNSTWISDPSMIEIGNKVTVGGSVTMLAHYGQGGLLVIAPIKIGDGVTLGIKATVMGGVTIGNGAKLMPHSVVLPNTVIPEGETWGGVPAVKVKG